MFPQLGKDGKRCPTSKPKSSQRKVESRSGGAQNKISNFRSFPDDWDDVLPKKIPPPTSEQNAECGIDALQLLFEQILILCFCFFFLLLWFTCLVF